jgi:hypothetical protein
MTLALLLSPRAAEALRTQRAGSELAGLKDLVETQGLDLRPTHPEASDPRLFRQFRIDIDDREAAEALAETLLKLEQVEAAYWKPAEAPP